MRKTYQSRNLRDSILDEFLKLNNDDKQFQASLKACDNKDSNWLNSFKQCTFEIDKYLQLKTKNDLFCDYLPYLSTIMNREQTRLQLFIEHTRRAKRFLHYLDSIEFYVSDFAKQFFLNDNYLTAKETR